MKTIILTTVMVLGFVVQSWGQVQNTYLDALQLKELYDKVKNNYFTTKDVDTKVNEILKRYGLSVEDLKDNPFLKKEFLPEGKKPEVVLKYIEVLLKNENISQDTISLFSKNFRETLSIKETLDKGNFNNNLNHNVVDGSVISNKKIPDVLSSTSNWQAFALQATADFMTERFTAEVVSMGINKAFKRLSETGSEEVVCKLFYETLILIDAIQQNNSGIYAADITLLKAVIKRDIENLPKTVFEISNNEDVKLLANVSFAIIDGAKKGDNVPNIISDIARNEKIKNSSISEQIKLLELLSDALLNKEGAENIWVNPVKELYFSGKDDELVARYFYGLLYEQLKDSSIKTIKNKLQGKNTEEIKNTIQNLTAFAAQLNSSYQLTKGSKFSFTSVDDYLHYSRNLVMGLKSFLNNPLIQDNSTLNAAINNIDNVLLVSELFLKQEYQRGISAVYVILTKQHIDLKEFRNINFLIELASVEKSDDMKKLLDAYALPIGSSAIKRKSRFNVSVNGYVGATGGFETAFTNNGKSQEINFGITAPIGFAFSTSNGKYCNWTLFLSVLDLGSMVNKRLNDDEIEGQDLKVTQFLAPGAGLYYNFQGTPLTLGLHYSYNFDMKKDVVNAEKNINVGRFNLSVLIDIPFFTICNKDYKKQR